MWRMNVQCDSSVVGVFFLLNVDLTVHCTSIVGDYDFLEVN